MRYFRVKNWERFQHYKDKNPPWIKLHFEILSSRDWVMLPDSSKLLAVACMLIASRNNGRVPDDKNYIQRVAYLDVTPDFRPLLESGFLESENTHVGDTLDFSRQRESALANSRPETETETEKEKEKDLKAFCSIVENPTTSPEPGDDPPILVFETNGKQKHWVLRKSKMAEWQELFPTLDVLHECKRARQWTIDRQRKTANGMPRFLLSWLSRANDQIRAPNCGTGGRVYNGVEKQNNSQEENQRLINLRVLG